MTDIAVVYDASALVAYAPSMELTMLSSSPAAASEPLVIASVS